MNGTFFRKNLARPEKKFRRTDHAKTRLVDNRTGMSNDAFKKALQNHLNYMQGVDANRATVHDYYMALSYVVRDRLVQRWLRTGKEFAQSRGRAVFYLSMEFLMGRQLGNNLLNIGCWDQAAEALAEHDIDLYDLLEQEAEPGLGNGGLGRLAACFLDSLTTLEIPTYGYGIRYEFGIFRQEIKDGWQVEHPDKWLLLGNPWEIRRPERALEVKFGGRTEHYVDNSGKERVRWIPDYTIIGVPYDTMVPGYGTDLVNTLRLWKAESSQDFDFELFNAGDYTRAVEAKTQSETISRVLYPNDVTPQGKELRLKQQFFFVSCCLQDILRASKFFGIDIHKASDYAAIQLNDTHPAIAVPELMRLLVDEEGLEWDKAWQIATEVFGFTNHTLLPEALEKWSLALFGRLFPRHMEIVYKINGLLLADIRKRFPGDEDRIRRMSLIEEGHEQHLRMAHLACVGSKAVNGVAALHSKLIREGIFSDFNEIWPEKFSNKTNGVTPRRWMLLSNPKMSALLAERIGKDWIRNADKLIELEPFAEDAKFRAQWREVKLENKSDLAEYILQHHNIETNPNSVFDILVKRIHEYKRQLLCTLHIITLYNRLRENPKLDIVPRTFIFGGKAAPGYFMAKLIIKLINSVANVVNADKSIDGKLRVVFLENFCVTLGEQVYCAAEVSEQISMAGKEASGTGNMKFAMNGALTIGTYDGANIEIREAVGKENFFLFGNTVEQLNELRSQGYRPRDYYENDLELKSAIDLIASGFFSPDRPELFQPIVSSLLEHDTYFSLADYRQYVDCQGAVDKAYRDVENWTKMSILNTARSGTFSSDRTISEYCQDIWKVRPLKVRLD